VTHPSSPPDRKVEADFSESAETAAAVSQLEVEPWRWLHDPRMVYEEYDAETEYENRKIEHAYIRVRYTMQIMCAVMQDAETETVSSEFGNNVFLNLKMH